MRVSAWITGAVCAAILSVGSARAEGDPFRGEKTLGIEVGYCGSNKSASAGVEFSFRFNRWFRLAPEAQYVFRRYGRDALTVNLNTQYPLMLHHDTMSFFPQAGLTYSSWNYHFDKTDGTNDDAVTRVSRLGANVGAGYEVNFTTSLRLSVRCGYTFMKDYGCFTCDGKIAYIF